MQTLHDIPSKDAPPRVLVLGGTGEGAQLATRLAERTDLTVISSLAGRVGEPKLPQGLVRIGGFGGLDALASYLVKEEIKAVIDATHPFAAKISHNAAIACNRAGVPLIALRRLPWEKVDGDLWHEVADFQSAASFLEASSARVVLSIGRQEVGAFSECKDAWFLIRAIEMPTEGMPPRHEVILQRGPFALEDELHLLRQHSIDYLVSKNSGGLATYTKIEAARSLKIPVVMIHRPLKPAVPCVGTVKEAIERLEGLLLTASPVSKYSEE